MHIGKILRDQVYITNFSILISDIYIWPLIHKQIFV